MRAEQILLTRLHSNLGSVVLLTGLALICVVPVAAQTVTIDQNKNVTTTDVAGDTYMFNIGSVSTTGTTALPVKVTAPNGSMQTDVVTVQALGGPLFSANGTLLTGPISCTINTATRQVVSGVCPPFAALFPVGTPEQVAATSVTTASNGAVGVARSQTLVVTNTISDRVRAISRDLARSLAPSQNKPVGSSYRGIAAGSAGSGLSIWGDASGSFLGNSTAAAGYHGTSVVALAGADYILDPQWIVGFSAGYTHDNITFSSVRGNSTADGALLGPYASYILGPNFSLDGQFTYTRLSNNISSVAPTPVGEFDGDRLTGAANLNAFTDFTPFTLIGFTGYAYTWQGNNIFLPNSVLPGLVSTPSSSSLILTNIRFGVFRLGGEAGYQMDQLEAYVPLTFEYQTTKPQDGAGRAALVVGAGLRYRWSDQLRGGIRATATEFETHIRDIKVEANLRWIF